jgi:hypothetical protein
MSVSCECRVLSGRGLCVGLIIRSEESYRDSVATDCDLETSTLRKPKPNSVVEQKKKNNISKLVDSFQIGKDMSYYPWICT